MASHGKDGDPLKMYTVVMALLCVVMAVLYFFIDNKRKQYEEANTYAEKYMTGKNLGRSRSMDADEPRTIPQLALAVVNLSETLKEATGGGGFDRSISAQTMENVASLAQLMQVYASRERRDKGRGGRYETVSQRFEYQSRSGDPPTQAQLLALLYNIESRGRYRVSELAWKLADARVNTIEPYDRIEKPQIEVSLRSATVEGD